MEMRPTWFGVLIIVSCMTFAAHGQEEFQDPVVCYECLDSAHNTTCGQPVTEDDLDSLGSVTCKKGACIKWTYYKNHELLMRRTCSENINLNIHLDHVCRSERTGNGYLCMCEDDMCNHARTLVCSKHWTMIMLSLLLPFIVAQTQR